MDGASIRFNAFMQAIETHPLRFNIDEKPTLDDLIERAKKIEAYIVGDGGSCF